MRDYRVIPSIEQLRQRHDVAPLIAAYGNGAVIDALREEAALARQALSEGHAAPTDEATLAATLVEGAATRLSATLRPSLRRVLNATGVIIHTNLGRAPLPTAALDRVRGLAGGYTNLEYDLVAGTRGARDTHAEALASRLTDAEAAVVVNNCAAATLLALTALARGREVLVSRSELVEIGGGFRVPDIMAQSGARLREVGTTNRTRAADYALAIGDRTGAILRVHHSNFRIEGFTERPALADLVALGRRFQVPVIEDLGSGLVTPGAPGSPLGHEPTVQASVQAGVDIVCFSGDKLLGGPQAGLIVGRREYVTRIRRHPLMRALRVDKLTYAALEATLAEHVSGRAPTTVPVIQMIAQPVEAIAQRAARLAAELGTRFAVQIVDGTSTVGGGSVPGSALPTRLLALERPGTSADALEAELRSLDPPVIARIEDTRVVLDLRTIAPEDDQELTRLLAALSSV